MSETARLVAASDLQSASTASVPFEDFFDEQKDGLYTALCLVTRNRHEAEELVQMHSSASSSDGTESPRWTILVPTCIGPRSNAFRSRYRRALLAAKRSTGLMHVDDEIARIDEHDAAVRALADLSPRQRAAVVLTDLLGFPSEEAARMLGIRASTLRMHASRAHAALKETMTRD